MSNMLTDPAPDVPGVRVSDKLADPARVFFFFSEHPRVLGSSGERMRPLRGQS